MKKLKDWWKKRMYWQKSLILGLLFIFLIPLIFQIYGAQTYYKNKQFYCFSLGPAYDNPCSLPEAIASWILQATVYFPIMFLPITFRLAIIIFVLGAIIDIIFLLKSKRK